MESLGTNYESFMSLWRLMSQKWWQQLDPLDLFSHITITYISQSIRWLFDDPLDRWRKTEGLQSDQSFSSHIMTFFTHFPMQSRRPISFWWLVTLTNDHFSCWWGQMWQFPNRFLIFPFRWLSSSGNLLASHQKAGFWWQTKRCLSCSSHRNFYPVAMVNFFFR